MGKLRLQKETNMGTGVLASKLFFVVLILAYLLGGPIALHGKDICSDANQVQLIKNPKDPDTRGGRLGAPEIREELTIKGLDKDRKPYYASILGLVADKEGNIYALDWKLCKVVKFSESGEYLKEFGRKGQGPGEFESPTGIALSGPGRIAIRGMRGITWFSLDGEYLAHKALMVWDPNPCFDSDGNIVGVNMWPSPDRRKMNIILQKFGDGTSPATEIAKFERVINPKIIDPFPVRLLYAVLKDNSVVWGTTDSYAFSVMNSRGLLVRRITKKYDPIEITQKERKNIIDEGGPLDPGEEYVFPKYYPAFKRVVVDDQDRLYVWTSEGGESGRVYDIFNPEGRYIAKIKFQFHPGFLANGRIYSIGESEAGLHEIQILAIGWPDDARK